MQTSMQRKVTLKKDHLDFLTLKKKMADLIKHEDRVAEQAYDSYLFFKKIVESDNSDATDMAKRCMVEALKVMTGARSQTTKVFEQCVKLYLETMEKTSPDIKREAPKLSDVLNQNGRQ